MSGSPLRLADAHVVLVSPRGAANLGAVARAMKNFGLSRLTLVEPRLGSWADAWRMAVDSGDVLTNARTVDSVDAAIADARWVVGTTRRPLPGSRAASPREIAAAALQRGAPTLLFGGEESGLSNEHLRRCHDLSTIAVAPEQPSLNLSQAVLLYVAELFAAAAGAGLAAPAPPPPPAGPAPAALLQRLEGALREALLGSAWAEKSRPDDAIGALLQPFWRAGTTEAEVRAWLVALRRIVRR